jgi:FkbM family methyltransferase
MTNTPDLLQQLTEHARLRRATKTRRAVAMGWRLAAVKAARVSGRQFPVTARTFWGDRMHVLLPEPLSCEVYGYRFFEEGLSAFMLAMLRPGHRVYDVGAHYGYFTRLASLLVGPSGAVHSFEPTPKTFSRLARNTADLLNVTCNNVAAWDKREVLHLTDFGTNLSMFNSLLEPRLSAADRRAGVDVAVQGLALDEYADSFGAPDFVKIDAESAEWHIVQGMSGLLSARRPMVTIEVGDFEIAGAARSRALLDHVIALGYAPLEYRDGQIATHVLKDTYGYDNILLKAA